MLRGPLFVPSLAVVAGVAIATRAQPQSPLLALALVASGLALGTRAGLALGCAGLGLLSVWVRPPFSLADLDLSGAVGFEGARVGPWQRGAYGWSARARLDRVSQGGRVRLARASVWLSLPGRERPPPGRRFEGRGALGRGPTFHNGGRIRPPDFRLRVKSRRLISFRGPPDWRRSVLAAGRREGPMPDGVALSRALVLGDASGLDRSLLQAFRRAGLGHLLALSGLHVGILAGAALGLARVGLARAVMTGLVWLVPALAMVGFLVLVGPRPAVSRAALMGVLACAAMAVGARPQSWHALSLVVALLVLVEPEMLSDLSFWLTTAATIAILWEVRRRRSGMVVSAIRVGWVAQLATLPWTSPAFALASPAAVVHNLWAVPWTALALVAGCGWVALTVIWPAAGSACEPLLELGAAPFRWAGSLRAGPWWSIPLSLRPFEAVAVAALGIASLRRPALGIAGLLALGACAGLVHRDFPGLELALLDVGQGDAILVRDGPRAVLIDGGGWPVGDFGGRVLVPALARLGVRRLDAVVVTHPDVDHCGGLVDLAAYMPIAEVWASPGAGPTSCTLRLIALPRVAWRPIWEGRRMAIGRWRIQTLHPPPGGGGDGNDRSVVLRVSAREFSALLTGDIEAEAEGALLRAYPPSALRADLLKVAHHGSRSSSGEAFLEAVRPRLAWISAGRANRYGHPHRSVVERLRERGARVLRTDRDGLVRLRIGETGTLHLSFPGAPAWLSPPG